MNSKAVFTLIAILLASGSGVNAIFNIEKGGLRIKFPASAASEHPDGFDMSLGNFGTPLYGGTLQGKLAYIDSKHGYDNKCSPDCSFGCQAFNASQPPLQLNRADGYIMLVDRGPTNSYTAACKFTEKVWNAQNAGAVAVLVVNYDDTHTTMDSPDEDDEDKNVRYLSHLTIPAAFVTKTTGDILKALITTGTAEQAYVIMDWTDVLPRASKVKWQFWSGSNDMCGAKCDIQKDFIKQFVPAAKELETQNWTEFQPHYLTHLCPEVYMETHECTTQCIHKGRYCAPDPDGSIEEGYSGGEVVQENLRQLCVFQLGNATGKPWVWWEYVTKFGEQCTMEANQYGRECAERVFQEVGGTTWSSLQAFRDCAGSTDEDRENPLLEEELRSRQGDGKGVGEIYILPTIRINGGQYRGRLSYTEVFRAVCAGFDRNAEPELCARLSDDSCLADSPGEKACAANSDGKTKCQNTFSGYSCECGNCYNEFVDKNGVASCQPKCNLKSCDQATGICQSSDGVGVLGVTLMIAVALSLVGGLGFLAYKWQIRREMRDEVKSILKQYMPLAEGDDGPGNPPGPAPGGEEV
jgi:hypothetical protein